MVIVDNCGGSAGVSVLPLGALSECLEGVTTRLAASKEAFRFTNLTNFKSLTAWNAAILSKDIVILPNVYEVVNENTEATYFESGSFRYKTAKEVKKMTSESYVSLCTHRAIRSLQGSEYTRLFEITDKGEVLGVVDTDGIKIKGQKMSDFDVAIRERPTNDKPGFTKVTITFEDFAEFEDNGAVAKSDFLASQLNGIIGLTFVPVSASATTIIVDCGVGCSSVGFEDLVLADFKKLTAAGVEQTISGVTSSGSRYTITGTGFTDGWLTTDGVVTYGGLNYEAYPAPIDVV